MLKTIALLVSIAFGSFTIGAAQSQVVNEANACLTPVATLEYAASYFESRFGEVPQEGVLSSEQSDFGDFNVLFFANPATGSWTTVLMEMETSRVCVIGYGKDWEPGMTFDDIREQAEKPREQNA